LFHFVWIYHNLHTTLIGCVCVCTCIFRGGLCVVCFKTTLVLLDLWMFSSQRSARGILFCQRDILRWLPGSASFWDTSLVPHAPALRSPGRLATTWQSNLFAPH
jgi:hypothetical protein